MHRLVAQRSKDAFVGSLVMQPFPQGQCEWVKCIAPPTKHVTFAYRVFETADLLASDLDRSTPECRDLCDKHAEHIARNYVQVTISDLDPPSSGGL